MGVKPEIKKNCGLIAVVMFGLLSGCAVLEPFESSLTEWEGHSVDELIASWGQPDQTSSLGNDTVAMTWAEQGGRCEHTFIVREERITGYSESGC